MKKYLLPKEGNFYKSNLHTHTTVSDGALSPIEVKKLYKEKGYSVVAYTDHEIMVPHLDLNDDDFLAITSTEISINKNRNCDFILTKTYHLNFYSKNPNKSTYDSFDKTILWLKSSYDNIDQTQWETQYDRVYSVECINEMIKKANDEGCLVSLNHPVWSLQDYSDYIGLKGLWGVEWHNTGCINTGYIDSIKPIDDLLRVGENVYPLATDDSHKVSDCFGGFTMIKAKELNYDVIFEALRCGDFYSTQGPLIDELYIEDGIVHIKTSKVKKIIITTDKRYTYTITAKEGENLTEASMDINWYFDHCNDSIIKHQYIRITLIDEQGQCAHTRAYYLNELQ